MGRRMNSQKQYNYNPKKSKEKFSRNRYNQRCMNKSVWTNYLDTEKKKAMLIRIYKVINAGQIETFAKRLLLPNYCVRLRRQV